MQLARFVRRSALLVVSIPMLASAAPTALAVAAGPPTLPAKAAPNSVAAFVCPANPVSTVDLEACEGHRLLKLDRAFNEQAAALWPLLDGTGRREFTQAQQAWLNYRDHACDVEARVYAGGTAAPVAYGQCETRLTSGRINDVAATLGLYCQGRDRTGPARHCLGS